MNKDQVNTGNDDLFHPTRNAGRESAINFSSPLLENGSGNSNSNSNSRSLLEVVNADHHLTPEPLQKGNTVHETSRPETTRPADGEVAIHTAIKDDPKTMILTTMHGSVVAPTAPIMKTSTATFVHATKNNSAEVKITINSKNKKKQRAKPGFGLRSSRTTIVETGQKRRSCICTNSKKCNELMTKWAKISPPDYHFVLLPKEHTRLPFTGLLSTETEIQHATGLNVGKTETVDNTNSTSLSPIIPGDSSNTPQHENNAMSSTDIYKNGFRYAALKHISAKNPLPKDERIALCHYHPEVRPYLFWPKNTPSAQKYAIPLALAIRLGYNVEAAKCRGLNTEKYCYALPIYPFEAAQKEIGAIQKDFHDRVQQIQTNPAQFVRDLRQLEEEVQEVHKLRKRKTELLRKLDDRRRSIKRLRSVLKVQQRHNAMNEAQQQQQLQQSIAAGQVTNDSNEVGPSDSNNGQQQQYQQHSYSTGTGTLYQQQQQQQLVDLSQQHQHQAVPVPQPLVLQNQNIQQHNQFFQPTSNIAEQHAIVMVGDGISESNQQQQQQDQQKNSRQHQHQHHQQQQHHHQHLHLHQHWAYNQQYQANPVGGPSGSENEQQQQPQQHLQPASIHAYDAAPNHDSQPHQNQSQPVTAPIEETNNPGNGFSTYAHQLEAAMAAAVAVGFKDDQEALVGAVEDDHPHPQHQHQSNTDSHPPPDNIVVGDVVHVDDLDDYNNHPNLDGGFGADLSDDDDLRDDDCSDTERYRQSLAGPLSQSIQRPRKWPRRTVILRPLSGSKEVQNDANKSTKNSATERSGSRNFNDDGSVNKGSCKKRVKTSKTVPA